MTTIPTPPPSLAPSQHPSPLPTPRQKPLNPGGTRETELITYLDHNMVSINHRFATRLSTTTSPSADKGYRNFGEAAKDIEDLIDVVWVSGSRTYPSIPFPSLFPH
ncbi:hypothetical protein EJ04DRAFT_513737 [Polyplosphaeria fusca]|uniref:Uncharacterized protein n=1 Tax=Polyplosphaeria fusca TaxID=682080 RepID=A0A9P4QWR4_9PLEO|nr:hypothetical protein EJ04DRAFT_513737 [Polyplosphaeria fusca]